MNPRLTNLLLQYPLFGWFIFRNCNCFVQNPLNLWIRVESDRLLFRLLDTDSRSRLRSNYEIWSQPGKNNVQCANSLALRALDFLAPCLLAVHANQPISTAWCRSSPRKAILGCVLFLQHSSKQASTSRTNCNFLLKWTQGEYIYHYNIHHLVGSTLETATVLHRFL